MSTDKIRRDFRIPQLGTVHFAFGSLVFAVLVELFMLTNVALDVSHWSQASRVQILYAAGLLLVLWTGEIASILLVGYFVRHWLPRILNRTSNAPLKTVVSLGSRFLVTIAGTMLVTFYIASWLFYLRVGHFLDFEAILFGLRNLEMIEHYLWQSQAVSLSIFAGLILVTAGSFWWCAGPVSPARQEGPAKATNPMPSRVLWVAMVIAAWMSLNSYVLAMEIVADREKTPESREHEISFYGLAASHTNPWFTVLVSALETSSGESPESFGLEPEVLGESRSLPSIHPITNKDKKLHRSVIVVAIESLRADVIGQEIHGQKVMPFTSKLAAEGIEFRNAYAQSTHSNYADPCVFSSLYPLRTKKHHYYSKLDPWPKTLLYDVLHAHGYQTGMFSSQNEGWGNMDSFLKSDSLDIFFDSRCFDGETYVPKMDSGFANYVQKAKVAGKLDDAVTVDKAIEWIEKCQRLSQPYCVCLNLQSSHFPYPIPETAPTPFEPASIDFEASFLSYPKEKTQIVQNAYFNALNYIDIQVNRLVLAASSSETLGTPIVVVLGDNGESFYEHGYPTHGGPPVEPQVNVALIAHCPGQLQPGKNDYLTQMIDVMPTVLGQLGIQSPRCAQGIDVLADNRTPSDERLAFFHCNNGRSKADAVLTADGWKCIIDNRENLIALHNIRADESESHDYSAEYPEVRKVLLEELEQWRTRQLGYYATSGYYGYWFPPKTPLLQSSDIETLRAATRRLLASKSQRGAME